MLLPSQKIWTLMTHFCNVLFIDGDRMNRDRPRFFVQVGHQTTYASIGNKYFFTK